MGIMSHPSHGRGRWRWFLAGMLSTLMGYHVLSGLLVKHAARLPRPHITSTSNRRLAEHGGKAKLDSATDKMLRWHAAMVHSFSNSPREAEDMTSQQAESHRSTVAGDKQPEPQLDVHYHQLLEQEQQRERQQKEEAEQGSNKGQVEELHTYVVSLPPEDPPRLPYSVHVVQKQAVPWDAFAPAPGYTAEDVAKFFSGAPFVEHNHGALTEYTVCKQLRDACLIHASEDACLEDPFCGWCSSTELCLDRLTFLPSSRDGASGQQQGSFPSSPSLCKPSDFKVNPEPSVADVVKLMADHTAHMQKLKASHASRTASSSTNSATSLTTTSTSSTSSSSGFAEARKLEEAAGAGAGITTNTLLGNASSLPSLVSEGSTTTSSHSASSEARPAPPASPASIVHVVLKGMLQPLYSAADLSACHNIIMADLLYLSFPVQTGMYYHWLEDTWPQLLNTYWHHPPEQSSKMHFLLIDAYPQDALLHYLGLITENCYRHVRSLPDGTCLVQTHPGGLMPIKATKATAVLLQPEGQNAAATAGAGGLQGGQQQQQVQQQQGQLAQQGQGGVLGIAGSEQRVQQLVVGQVQQQQQQQQVQQVQQVQPQQQQQAALGAQQAMVGHEGSALSASSAGNVQQQQQGLQGVAGAQQAGTVGAMQQQQGQSFGGQQLQQQGAQQVQSQQQQAALGAQQVLQQGQGVTATVGQQQQQQAINVQQATVGVQQQQQQQGLAVKTVTFQQQQQQQVQGLQQQVQVGQQGQQQQQALGLQQQVQQAGQVGQQGQQQQQQAEGQQQQQGSYYDNSGSATAGGAGGGGRSALRGRARALLGVADGSQGQGQGQELDQQDSSAELGVGDGVVLQRQGRGLLGHGLRTHQQQRVHRSTLTVTASSASSSASAGLGQQGLQGQASGDSQQQQQQGQQQGHHQGQDVAGGQQQQGGSATAASSTTTAAATATSTTVAPRYNGDAVAYNAADPQYNDPDTADGARAQSLVAQREEYRQRIRKQAQALKLTGVTALSPTVDIGHTSEPYEFVMDRMGLSRFVPLSRPKVVIVQRSSKRFLLNVEELVVATRELGVDVQVAYFEQLTLHEQLSLLSTCTILVGLHGGPLKNHVFQPYGAALVEIVPLKSAQAAVGYYSAKVGLHGIYYHKVEVEEAESLMHWEQYKPNVTTEADRRKVLETGPTDMEDFWSFWANSDVRLNVTKYVEALRHVLIVAPLHLGMNTTVDVDQRAQQQALMAGLFPEVDVLGREGEGEKTEESRGLRSRFKHRSGRSGRRGGFSTAR